MHSRPGCSLHVLFPIAARLGKVPTFSTVSWRRAPLPIGLFPDLESFCTSSSWLSRLSGFRACQFVVFKATGRGKLSAEGPATAGRVNLGTPQLASSEVRE